MHGFRSCKRMLATTMALPIAVFGCTASGYPDFVKFSPDGRRLVYQDARYPRVYIYDLKTRQKYVLKGRIASLNREVDRFVLLPHRYTGVESPPAPLPCCLVTFEHGGPQVERLPGLPLGSGVLPVVVMELGPEQQQILATIYEHQSVVFRTAPHRDYLLKFGQDEWTAVRCPRDFPRHPPAGPAYIPSGVREGRHVFCPDPEPPMNQLEFKSDYWGFDVETEFRNDRIGLILRSPDGSFVVRICDIDDPWGRVTLTEVATGRKEIILNKNDAALGVLDVLGKVALLPVYPFLPKF